MNTEGTNKNKPFLGNRLLYVDIRKKIHSICDEIIELASNPDPEKTDSEIEKIYNQITDLQSNYFFKIFDDLQDIYVANGISATNRTIDIYVQLFNYSRTIFQKEGLIDFDTLITEETLNDLAEKSKRLRERKEVAFSIKDLCLYQIWEDRELSEKIIELREQFMRDQRILNNVEDVPDMNISNDTQKLILLNELGIINFLITEYPETNSAPILASLVKSFASIATMTKDSLKTELSKIIKDPSIKHLSDKTINKVHNQIKGIIPGFTQKTQNKK